MESLHKKIVLIAIVSVLLLLLASSFKLIRPGYVGVVVDLFGSKRGVEANEKHVGIHIIPPWKHIYIFPTFQQNDTWENRDNFQFQTSDGLAMRADKRVLIRDGKMSTQGNWFIFKEKNKERVTP